MPRDPSRNRSRRDESPKSKGPAGSKSSRRDSSINRHPGTTKNSGKTKEKRKSEEENKIVKREKSKESGERKKSYLKNRTGVSQEREDSKSPTRNKRMSTADQTYKQFVSTEAEEDIQPVKESVAVTSLSNEEVVYEDDFEEYEEDFESEEEEILEERKMDSGNYDVSPAMMKEIEEVKNAISLENSTKNTIDEKHIEVPESKEPQSPPAIFNFNSAKQRNKERNVYTKTKRRGQELLNMIRLDTVSMELLNVPPISYDNFMLAFSKGRQILCQTGDDNVDVDIQTDEIKVTNKWTQFPPSMKFHQELSLKNATKGVGGDTEEHVEVNRDHFEGLREFVSLAGNVISGLIEEKQTHIFDNAPSTHKANFSVSKMQLSIPKHYSFLTSVTLVRFAPDHPYILYTCHEDSEKTKSYIATWNLTSSPNSPPQKLYICRGSISSFCVSQQKANMIFAGLKNGVVAVWDPKKHSEFHNNGKPSVHIFPTFVENTQHESKIISIESLANDKEAEILNSFQVISIEEKSKIVIWTVLEDGGSDGEIIGLAHWGSARLVPTTVIKLGDEIRSSDICTNDEGNRILVASDDGKVLHFSRRDGASKRPSPSTYKPEVEDLTARCTKIVFSYFEHNNFFVGAEDGSVRLYSVKSEKPIVTWPVTVDGTPVRDLVISSSRPCVFFALDSNSRIHSWDLRESDIAPICTTTIDGVNITSIDVNRGTSSNIQKQLMAIGLSDGNVEVHTLREEFQSPNEERTREELESLSYYLSLL